MSARRGTTLFWLTVGAFLLVDVALALAPQFPAVPMRQVAPVFSYALLGGFALGFAVIAAIVIGAVRERRTPSGSDVVRATIVVVLMVAHVVLLLVASRR